MAKAMKTSKLKKFAQFARRSLIEQVSNKLKLVLVEGSTARRESAEVVKKLEEQIKKIYESGDEPEHWKQTADAYRQLRIAWERAIRGSTVTKRGTSIPKGYRNSAIGWRGG